MRNGARASLLVGVPIGPTPDDRFFLSLHQFLMRCQPHYRLEYMGVKDKPLVEAQNMIADYFMSTDHQYLLLLEDDHYGHERMMLQALLRSDAEVSGINYYSRHWPYYECLMKDLGKDHPPSERFGMTGFTEGLHEVDLIGYAMMLIQREVFEKLDKPYFRLNKDGGVGNYATDIDFCDRCKEKGIKLMGCFDYTLPHRDITKENRMERFTSEFAQEVESRRTPCNSTK